MKGPNGRPMVKATVSFSGLRGSHSPEDGVFELPAGSTEWLRCGFVVEVDGKDSEIDSPEVIPTKVGQYRNWLGKHGVSYQNAAKKAELKRLYLANK